MDRAYSAATITTAGGAAPYTWSATGLPPGLSIDPATGMITGAPTTANGSPFLVEVTMTDSRSATVNTSYSLTIFSLCDLNRDTYTDANDVQIVLREALGLATPVHDLNHDSAVNVIDVQIVENAVLGMGCSAQ